MQFITLCAFVAQGVAVARAMPEPTRLAPAADTWSPAPTPAPYWPNLELFRRQQSESDNTCGFANGSSESSITCSKSNFICATNTRYGVHGCCDANVPMSSCTLFTTCIPQTAIASACTNSACSSDPAILRCTSADMTECYRYIFVYSKTSMTEHGCAASKLTSTIQRTWGTAAIPTSTPVVELYRTITVYASPSPSPVSLLSSFTSSKTNLGAIIGGTIGACSFISLIALAFFLRYRKRQSTKQQEVTSTISPPQTHFHDPSRPFSPHTKPSSFFSPTITALTPADDDPSKPWSPHRQHEPNGCMTDAARAVPQYPGMSAEQYGIIEADGHASPVEVEGRGISSLPGLGRARGSGGGGGSSTTR